MSLRLPISVLSCGMMTAVGFNRATTAAAVAARVAGIRQDNLWDRTAAGWLKVGRVRTPQWWEGPDMLAELAAPAILECRAQLRAADPEAIPIVVLLSEPSQPEHHPQLQQIIQPELEARLGHSLAQGSRVISGGRTGFWAALMQLDGLAIVVAVDSFLRQPIADEYMRRHRLLAKNNSNGFVPGEAACALAVASRNASRPALSIVGCGRGQETGTIESTEPLTGDGLTDAARQALAQARLDYSDIAYWYADTNGEHHKFKERAIVQMRLDRIKPGQAWRKTESLEPLQFLGEIGAATTTCFLGLALEAHSCGDAAGEHGLITVGDDNGERLALVTRFA